MHRGACSSYLGGHSVTVKFVPKLNGKFRQSMGCVFIYIFCTQCSQILHAYVKLCIILYQVLFIPKFLYGLIHTYSNSVYSVPGSVTHVIRDEDLVFQPREMNKIVPITLIDDERVAEIFEVFNISLSVQPAQPIDTAIQNGVAVVFVLDDDESMLSD